ncbi:UDP-glucosyltransferase 2-like [Leptopilina heterotoma]|uniref:UDP-glucosyltransferase 2-like n=1 Tax=Leptopilina heterotoma TaxID=63436 RepID=UPI001CA9351B|nr:UDP-glucosyltransferase 2-like [Leptopilina heterotoma]
MLYSFRKGKDKKQDKEQPVFIMTFIRRYVILSLFIFSINFSEESRILAIFPNPGHDGDISNKALVTILLERGHHVDLISRFEIIENVENSLGNYTFLLNFNEIDDYSESCSSSEFTSDPVWYTSEEFGNKLCNMLGDKEMQKLFRNLRENFKYDIILMEIFGAKCFIGLGEFLKAPVILISNQVQLSWIEESIVNPESIYITNCFKELNSEASNIFTRLRNSLMILFQNYQFYRYTQRQTEIMRKYLDPKLPEITQMEKNVSLILSNSHYSLNSIRPLTSAFVQIGGLHIAEDKSKLSSKLKRWMDKNTKGIVYFDLGPKILLENLPRKMIIAFLASFAKIKPFQVLLRVKDVEKLPLELPRNVKACAHIPRIQVLAHKNVKAFITLGENFALQEALYFGVPIIGISYSLVHSQNLQSLVEKFVAFEINFEDLNEPKINEALTIVLNVKIISQQAKRWSKIFKDRPSSAKETAIYWIEYIIDGPKSFKSPTIFLDWYQYELLDIYALLLFFLLSLIYSFVLILKKIKIENFFL